MALAEKIQKRHYRHKRICKRIAAQPAQKPRLVIFRSLKYNYVQLVDDKKKKVLASASDLKINKGTKRERAKKVGLLIAEKALELKIKECAFDRAGYKYGGRVAAIAEGAREGGLKF